VILRGLMASAAPAGPAYTTLDPTAKDPSVTLSGGNLIATFTIGFWASVKGVAGKAAGKFYFEANVAVTAAAGTRAVGVGTSSAGVGGYPGQDANAWGHLSDGYKTHSGFTAYGTAWDSLHDVVMVAVDIAAGKVWFGVNGTWMASGDPATGANPTFASVAGTLYPMVGGNAAGGSPQLTMNFGSSAFAYAPPAGFAGWTT
jgi:hypothetical protein